MGRVSRFTVLAGSPSPRVAERLIEHLRTAAEEAAEEFSIENPRASVSVEITPAEIVRPQRRRRSSAATIALVALLVPLLGCHADGPSAPTEASRRSLADDATYGRLKCAHLTHLTVANGGSFYQGQHWEPQADPGSSDGWACVLVSDEGGARAAVEAN